MNEKCPECQSENLQAVNKKDSTGKWVWLGAFDCLDCGYEHPHEDTQTQNVIKSPGKNSQRL